MYVSVSCMHVPALSKLIDGIRMPLIHLDLGKHTFSERKLGTIPSSERCIRYPILRDLDVMEGQFP